MAQSQGKQGHIQIAQGIYRDILERFPKNLKAAQGLKGLQGGSDSHKPLIEDPPENKVQQLINLYSQGLLQPSLKYASELIAQYPRSAVLHNICGAVYAGLQHYESAIDSYRQALNIKPDYADAFNNLGGVLEDQGDSEGAIESYRRALDIKPDSADTYNNLGNALKNQGDLDGAIENYRKALELRSDYAVALYNLGNALNDQGDLSGAIECYQHSLDITPHYPEALNNLGNVLHAQGDLGGAVEYYRTALRIAPDYGESHTNLGRLLMKMGQHRDGLNEQKLGGGVITFHLKSGLSIS